MACIQNYPQYKNLEKTFENQEYYSFTKAAQDAFSTQGYVYYVSHCEPLIFGPLS